MPASVADYRETFDALDLEVRFQLITSREDLRGAAVAAVRDGLTELRQALAHV